MGTEVVNKNRECVFYGPYAGRDLYVTMFQENQREFVVTHNTNIKPVSYFVGRETELQELRQRIETGRRSVLVSGMGGIGKTHICRKLFEEYLTKHDRDESDPFRHIGYIEYDGNMDNSLQNCLKYKQQDNPLKNREAAWRELEYLASDGNLLLFVDNVDKPVGDDPGLQRLKEIPGTIVMTSRHALFDDEFELYQIGFLSMAQCKKIYEKIRYGDIGEKVRPDEVYDLEYVIESLAGRHTITVEFLAHLARTKIWSVKRLREELEQKGFRLTFHKDGEIINIQESYEVLYDFTELSEAEQNILEAFSVFPYIPLQVEICNQWLLADAGVCEDDDILSGLYQKGWLQYDAVQEGYVLHSVFAQFIYEKSKPRLEKHEGLIEECNRQIKLPKSGSASAVQKFIPYVESVIEKVDMGNSLKQIGLIGNLAYLLEYIAEYKKAEKLFEKHLEVCEQMFGAEHLNTSFSYYYLAGVYVSQGKYEAAVELYKKSIFIREKTLGEDHLYTAAGYHNLAQVYHEQGEYTKAGELYEKSLKVCESELGENNIETTVIYNNLAGVYHKRGEYAKAEPLYAKCLRVRKSVLGENHPEIATIYNNLADMYEMQGKCEQAEVLYKKSLGIRERILGENHPDTAISYNNLAYMYEMQGKYEQAEALYKKSLGIREKILGGNHPETATSYNNLAHMYEGQGEFGIALDYYFTAYKILVINVGFNYPNTQIVYKNMEIAFSKWNSNTNFKQWLDKKWCIED